MFKMHPDSLQVFKKTQMQTSSAHDRFAECTIFSKMTLDLSVCKQKREWKLCLAE